MYATVRSAHRPQAGVQSSQKHFYKICNYLLDLLSLSSPINLILVRDKQKTCRIILVPGARVVTILTPKQNC